MHFKFKNKSHASDNIKKIMHQDKKTGELFNAIVEKFILSTDCNNSKCNSNNT